MLRISNLRPPASKAGKQPPLSFQFCRFTSKFFSERQSDRKFSVNRCGLCENRTRGVQETVGQVTITSIDHFFCGEQRNRTFTTVVELISSKPQQTIICLLSFCDLDRDRTCNPRFRKPMLYPIELRDLCNPRKIWTFNPRFKIHLSYEIIFVIAEGLEPSTFGVSDRCSNPLSYAIFTLGISGDRTLFSGSTDRRFTK